MTKMTEAERLELEELREFKRIHEGKALNRAFAKLENLLNTVNHDPIMSVRAFRTVADCLLCLKEEMEGLK